MKARLKAKAYRWKKTALAATKRYSLLRAQLRRSRARVKRLEAELAAHGQASAPIKVAGHTYPAQLIALAVFIVVHGNGSLRCAAKTVGFVSQLLGWSYSAPSHNSVRRWVLRIGLDQLHYGTEKVGEYVAILDESIQIGAEKLLLLLGVKMAADRSHFAPLSSCDVEVLGLEVQSSWTGELVAEFIDRNLSRWPKLQVKYFITDGGTNLAKALRILGQNGVSDCTHIMMNAVKKLLVDDKILSELSAKIGQLRRQLILSSDSFLLPATLRDKDRFLRIFTIVHWVERIDKMWAKLPIASRQKLSFINKARPRILVMKQLKELVALSAGILKTAGLSDSSRKRWEEMVAAFQVDQQLTPQAESFINTLRNYFTDHHQLIAYHGRLLCCSDIIESTFGRYKNKGGTPTISADVLKIVLYNVTLTPQLVQKALLRTTYQTVHAWETEHICENRYGLVRRMNRELISEVA